MAVLTKTKKRVVPEADVDEDVETKEEPKVVVDKGLVKLVTDWDVADKKAESYWPRIVEYVHDNEITRAQLKQVLIDYRGMKELTANNEVSKIFKATEHMDLLQQVLDGEMTQRDFREQITKKQEGTDDPDNRFKKSIRRVASFAIQEVELEQAEFVSEAKSAYKEVYAKLEAKASREADGASEDEGEEEEE